MPLAPDILADRCPVIDWLIDHGGSIGASRSDEGTQDDDRACTSHEASEEVVVALPAVVPVMPMMLPACPSWHGDLAEHESPHEKSKSYASHCLSRFLDLSKLSPGLPHLGGFPLSPPGCFCPLSCLDEQSSKVAERPSRQKNETTFSVTLCPPEKRLRDSVAAFATLAENHISLGIRALRSSGLRKFKMLLRHPSHSGAWHGRRNFALEHLISRVAPFWRESPCNGVEVGEDSYES